MLRKDKSLIGSSNILGINLDGERLLVVYGSPTGTVYERLSAPIPAQANFAAVLELIMVQADRLLTLTQAQHLALPERVSVAISGNLDPETGILSSAIDFPAWKQEPVRSQLSLRFNLPVALEQKANAGALAEYYFGSGQNVRNLVFLSMSPTLRAGILTNGRLYHNSGGTAGQLGSLRLAAEGPAGSSKPGTLSDFASAAGMLELARKRCPQHWDRDTNLFQVIRDAQAGDPFAQDVFAEAGAQLGRGLAALVHLLQPDLIIVGFPGCLLEEHLLEPARAALAAATELAESALPGLIPSALCARLPELEAIAPAIHQFHSQNKE
ncbi:MAG TPA: ROK family protein [Anaerolineaceae bacterium]|nr:ROK family protein [Anaerolineaceae bacterium]